MSQPARVKREAEEDNKPRSRAISIKATLDQARVLKAFFEHTESPSVSNIEQLVAETGLESKWIRSWFGRHRRYKKTTSRPKEDKRRPPSSTTTQTATSVTLCGRVDDQISILQHDSACKALGRPDVSDKPTTRASPTSITTIKIESQDPLMGNSHSGNLAIQRLNRDAYTHAAPTQKPVRRSQNENPSSSRHNVYPMSHETNPEPSVSEAPPSFQNQNRFRAYLQPIQHNVHITAPTTNSPVYTRVPTSNLRHQFSQPPSVPETLTTMNSPTHSHASVTSYASSAPKPYPRRQQAMCPRGDPAKTFSEINSTRSSYVPPPQSVKMNSPVHISPIDSLHEESTCTEYKNSHSLTPNGYFPDAYTPSSDVINDLYDIMTPSPFYARSVVPQITDNPYTLPNKTALTANALHLKFANDFFPTHPPYLLLDNIFANEDPFQAAMGLVALSRLGFKWD